MVPANFFFKMYAFELLFLWNFLFVCFVWSGKGPCKKYFNGCCPHTKWDWEKDTCVDCPRGYYWINCNRTCRYPSYGDRCELNCNCKMEMCNFMTGCSKALNTTNNSYQKISKGLFSYSTYIPTDNMYTAETKTTIHINRPINGENTTNLDQQKKKGTKNAMDSEFKTVKNYTNTKYILLIVGMSVLGVVLMAYITVLIIDKRLKSIIREHTKQDA